jgi:iron complex outermembrane receptor protein
LAAGVTSIGSAFAGENPRTGESFVLRGQELNALRDLRIDGFATAADRNVLDLAPFERVEAVKGPASMLYGQGSLGGFINLVRKKPRAERSLRMSAEAGSYDTYRTEIDATGALNQSKTVLGQVALAYEDSGSFIDHVDSRRAVFAPTLEWRLSEDTRAQLAFIYQDDRFRPSLGIDLVERGDRLVIPDIPRSRFFGVPNSEDSDSSTRHTTLTLDHRVNDRWLTTLIVHNSKNELLGISDGYGYGVDDDGNTNLYSSFVAHDNESWAGEVRVDGRFDAFGREHQLLLGAEANRREEIGWGGGGYTVVGEGNIYSGEFTGGFPGHDNPRNYNADGSDSNKGVYAQLLLSVAERTRLLLGARHDRTKQDTSFTPVGEEPAQFDKLKKSDTTMRFALTQEFGAGVLGYGSWSQSFNPVFERGRDGVLDPETGEGYELGLKGEWLDGRLGASLAVFRQELDNRAIPDVLPDDPPDVNFSKSAGLQRTDGVEIEVAGQPLPGLDVQFASAWLDAEYKDRDDPNFGLTPGGTVERQTSLYAAYELQQGALRGLGFGATVVSVGDRIVLSDRNLDVKGYERYDLHAFYRGLRHWELSLLLRNLSEERYIEQVNSSYAYAHFFGSPRALLLRAEYRFDL